MKPASTDNPVLPASSTAFIPEISNLRRLPLAPHRQRPEQFWSSYESRALVYDCFRHHLDERVIIVGPPPLNLEIEWHQAAFSAGGVLLSAKFHPSRSTMLIELTGAPKEASAIDLSLGGMQYRLPIRPNEAEQLARRRVLVTMNKDNDLEWIAAWARWHATMHGADACLFFDNGSTLYTPAQIADTLKAVPGMETVRVLSWPYAYGRKDPALLNRPHYPHFLQVSSLNVALRRFAMKATGLLNCDIDELVSAVEGNVFEAALDSVQGLITLKGNWVEPVAGTHITHGIPHLAFRHTHRMPLFSRCANKWVLHPSRDWLADLAAKPSVHRIYDVPRTIGSNAPVRRFWHFKAINTGWKESRLDDRPPSPLLKRSAALDADAENYGLILANGRASRI